MANRIPVQQQSVTCSFDRKKQGVSAESSESTGQASDITITKYEKDFRYLYSTHKNLRAVTIAFLQIQTIDKRCYYGQ